MPTIHPALTPITYLPGLIYEGLIRLRNRMYASELLSERYLSQPVISIGNITMGGTGKTPIVIFTARILSDMGFDVAILTRGYGRRNPKKSIILMPEQTISTPEQNIGDEPSLIRYQLPSIWMGISHNRFLAGNAIAKQKSPMVFLLDDGFQHRELHRDLDIVIIDPSQPLENNHLFPLGTLREPASELQRANAIVVNGLPDSQSISEFETRLSRFSFNGPLFHCTQSIHALIPFAYWKNAKGESISAKLPHSAYLVAAIGNPERFHNDIRRMGIEVRGANYFRDHYRLQEKDWRNCVNDARKCGAEAIVVTEKDAVKITHPPEFPLQIAMQSTEIHDISGFRQLLQKMLKEHGQGKNGAKLQ
jgi:tetraacyldisaccharide 4'-kinase